MYMYSMCIIKVGVRDDWSVGYVQKQLTVIGLHRLLCFQWKLKFSSQRRHLISSFAVYAVEWAWKRTALLRHCFLPRPPPIFFWSVHCCSIYRSDGPLGPGSWRRNVHNTSRTTVYHNVRSGPQAPLNQNFWEVPHIPPHIGTEFHSTHIFLPNKNFESCAVILQKIKNKYNKTVY